MASRRLSSGQVLLGLASVVVLLVALTIRGNLVFGIVVVGAIFVPIERAFGIRAQRVFRKGWATDIVHFVVNNLLTTVGVYAAVIAVGLAMRAVVPSTVRASIHGQRPWVQLIEALLLSEVCFYFAHRAAHAVPLLWRFHKIHHSIKEMDWLASAHLHPIDQAFTRSCAILPLFALGFSKATFGGFLVFSTFQALFIHSNVRLTFGPLRWVLTTPEFHHWHHANDPSHFNTNFAGEFPLLDLIFGTLHLENGASANRTARFPELYGIAEPIPSGYLRQLAWPFHR